MIIRYNPSKVYNPKELKHVIRRAMQKNYVQKYTPIRLESMATKLILCFPIARMLLEKAIKKGMLLLDKIEDKQLKEESLKCQQHCRIQ